MPISRTALGEEVGENSVEPDHHEQGREETEEAGEPGHHAIAHQMVGNVLLKDRKLHLDAGIFFAPAYALQPVAPDAGSRDAISITT